MAQVRKFNTGGALIINGKQYTAEQINEYINSANLSSSERAALAGTVNAIAKGESRVLDRNANSLIGEGVQEDFSGFYGNDKRGSKNVGRSSKWANRQARRNSDHHIVNSAIAALGGIEDFYNKKKEEDKPTLAYGSGWFDRDDNGNYISGPGNISREKHIRSVFEALASGQTPELASGWGENYDNLKNWYQAGYDPEELFTAIRNNKLSAEQLDVLKAMGYVQSTESKDAATIADLKQKFVNAGYDYDTWSPYVTFDENGRMIARTGEDGKSVFAGLGGNGNYYFNQQFADANSKYAFLKDHFLIDGVFYKASDASDPNSELYKYLRKSGGFYDLNKAGDWLKADELIRQYWDGKTRTPYGTGATANIASSFLKSNPTYRWMSVTGAYDYPLESGQQLIEIYDPSQTVDAFGWGKTRYAVLDKNGNFVKWTDENGESIPMQTTGNESEPLKGRRIIDDVDKDSLYYGKEIWHPTGSGLNPPFTLYWDSNKNELIYQGDLRNVTGIENKAIGIPSEIAAILMRDPDKFINNLMKTGRLAEFQAELGGLVNTGFGDKITGTLFTNELDGKDWAEILEISEEEGNHIAELFEYYGSSDQGNKKQRMWKYLKEPYTPGSTVTVQKLGGKINYLKKLQPGGTVGTTETKGHTEFKIDGPVRDTRNFAKIGSEEFTAADWTELGALVADLGGLAVGASGAPIASGVIGAVGSTAGFAADVTRDGLDWGDVGSYGVNLLFDLASVLPFLGSAAQGAKVAKGIQKAGKVIGKVFNNPKVVKSLAAMGLGSAITASANKIINGEDWNMRDIRNVLNGLNGFLTLNKTGLFKGGKSKITGEIDVKIKGKNTKEKLTEAELAEIQSKTGEDVNKTIREIIVKKNPKQKLKADDIDLSPAKIEKKIGLRFWKGKQPTGKYDLGITTEKVSPELTGKGIADGSQSTQRFNEWLRTGQWFEPRMRTKQAYFKTKKEAIDAGGQNLREFIHPQKGTVMDVRADVPTKTPTNKIDEVGDVLRTAAQKDWWNPFRSLNPNTRAMLRKASFTIPNILPNFQQSYPVPVGFVPMDETGYHYYKKGGSIKKYQDPADVMVDINGESKKMTQTEYDKMVADQQAANLKAIKDQYGFTFSELTDAEKEEFKRLKSEAEKNGTDFVFKGKNFGKVTPSEEVPTITPEKIEIENAVDPAQTFAKLSPEEEEAKKRERDLQWLNSSIEKWNAAHPDKPQRELYTLDNLPENIGVEMIRNSNIDWNKIDFNNFIPITEEPVNEQSLSYDVYQEGPWAMEAYASAQSDLAMKAAADAGYSKFRQKQLGRKAYNSAYKEFGAYSIGSQKGNSFSPETALEILGGINSASGKLGIGLTQSGRQRALARKDNRTAKSNMASNPQEIYGTFDDGGIKQVYDNAAVDAESIANNPVTSDAVRNRQFRRQAAAEARKLRAEGGFRQSQAFSNWKLNQERIRDDYATKRTAVENTNRQRMAAADAMLNQQLGAGIAQDAGLWQGFVGDVSKIASLPRAQKYQTQIQDLQNEYSDWKTGLKGIYDKGIEDKSIASGTTFDSWINSNKNYLNQQRDYQRRMSNLSFKYKMNSLYKKGGKVRPTEEQIKIDNEKARQKAISQLSKQAFELLKMALK